MSTQITTSMVDQFHANVDHLVQQKNTVYRGSVREEPLQGEYGFYDQVGAVDMVEKAGRHTDTPQIDTPHARRRVTPKNYEWADLVDKEDKVRVLMDPESEYAIAGAMAARRQFDKVVIAEQFADASTGRSGATTVQFPASQTIVHGSVGLTIDKLRTAKFILDNNDVDEEIPRHIKVSAKQIQDLLESTEVTSADYNTVRALVQGEIDTFLGFRFRRTNLQSKTTTIRDCCAYAEDGLLLAVNMDTMAEIERRADKSYATQVYYALVIGSTRMEEEKVVKIECDEGS